MAVSKRVRFEVFKRDAFTCCYCGRKPPEVMLHCDHVHPVAAGGTDDMDNLTTSCVACNQGKSDKPLGAVVPSLDEAAVLSGIQEALERAAHLKSSLWAADLEREATDEAVAVVLAHLNDVLSVYTTVPIERSVRTFVRKLDVGVIVDAVDLAASRKHDAYWEDRWKYFCGICWGKIKGTEVQSATLTIDYVKKMLAKRMEEESQRRNCGEDYWIAMARVAEIFGWDAMCDRINEEFEILRRERRESGLDE